MHVIDVLPVGNKRIELLQGDLSAIPREFETDLLIISAFPGDYTPSRTSVMGALHARGLSVALLAKDMAEDLRDQCACWLSQEIDPATELQFRRLLCFEPWLWGKPTDIVGEVFRALIPTLGSDTSIRSVAMPILSSGDQGYPLQDALPPLLEASGNWLNAGLPLDVIRIVTHSDSKAREAAAVFAGYSAGMKASTTSEPGAVSDFYDLFISYSHKDTPVANELLSELREGREGIRVFFDRKELRPGSAWQPEIFESLDRCRRVVTLLSPGYVASTVCREEFNIAWVRERDDGNEILFPLYIRSAKLPSYMKYRQYLDCREAERERIVAAARDILSALDEVPSH